MPNKMISYLRTIEVGYNYKTGGSLDYMQKFRIYMKIFSIWEVYVVYGI